jgi:hypothetical protein
MSNRHPATALENRKRTCDETKVLGYPAPAYEADHRRDTRGRPDRPASRNHIHLLFPHHAPAKDPRYPLDNPPSIWGTDDARTPATNRLFRRRNKRHHLAPWLACRVELPIGQLFCVIDGPTRGRPWSATAARGELRRYAVGAGVRRRFAPHQPRHAHAVELAREGVPLPVIQRQLGHSYVFTTSVYLKGIDVEEIIGNPRAARRLRCI